MERKMAKIHYHYVLYIRYSEARGETRSKLDGREG